ncbi:hypothetical protein DKX38_020723 [Salix brachista]|uniref:Uncharacterized protein n=1 Tax=Salix brachista TaxID=2182728 RepID=A0A5N5K7L7_9ROSI|nr:hypothetical protein DKX38_020723 [Salix brachista]
MGRKQTDPELGLYGLLVLFVMVQSPVAWSTFVSLHCLDHRKATEFLVSKVSDGLKSEDADGDCCRGIEHLELWGDAVKWGSEFNVNSSKACCLACKGMCSGGSGPLLLLPGCAPYSISYILDLLISHHCLGCHFYRAESRGKSWDSEEMAIDEATCMIWDFPLLARYAPPFALIQGALGAYGTVFKDIPTEACPPIRIDMGIVERIAQPPTKPEVRGNVNAAVLENPVRLHVRRINRSAGNQNLNTNRDSSSSGS